MKPTSKREAHWRQWLDEFPHIKYTRRFRAYVKKQMRRARRQANKQETRAV